MPRVRSVARPALLGQASPPADLALHVMLDALCFTQTAVEGQRLTSLPRAWRPQLEACVRIMSGICTSCASEGVRLKLCRCTGRWRRQRWAAARRQRGWRPPTAAPTHDCFRSPHRLQMKEFLFGRPLSTAAGGAAAAEGLAPANGSLHVDTSSPQHTPAREPPGAGGNAEFYSPTSSLNRWVGVPGIAVLANKFQRPPNGPSGRGAQHFATAMPYLGQVLREASASGHRSKK